MFKIEYDMVIDGTIKSFTFDFIFHSLWAAGLKARDIRDTKHVDVYVINTKTGEVVDYYWA